MICLKLQELKDASGMTYQQISEKSGVPFSTVKRIFSGRTPDPCYSTVVALLNALGDEDENPINIDHAAAQTQKESVPPTQSDHAKICEIYEKAIADKNKLISWLLAIIIGLTLIFVFLLIWDLCNPDVGFFRTQTIVNSLLKKA